MSRQTADELRAEAETLIAANGQLDTASAPERAAMVDALAVDLGAVAQEAETAEDRLVRIETQTRLLAEAVVAITDSVRAVAPAAQALKDNLNEKL